MIYDVTLVYDSGRNESYVIEAVNENRAAGQALECSGIDPIAPMDELSEIIVERV